MRWDKNENVTTRRLMEIKNLYIGAWNSNAIDELADQDSVSDEECVFH